MMTNALYPARLSCFVSMLFYGSFVEKASHFLAQCGVQTQNPPDSVFCIYGSLLCYWVCEFYMQMDGNRKHYPECDNSDPKRWI